MASCYFLFKVKPTTLKPWNSVCIELQTRRTATQPPWQEGDIVITLFLREGRALCNLMPQLLLRCSPDGSLPLAETSTTLLLLKMKNVLAWWLSEDTWGGHKRAPCKRWATGVALIEECSGAADGIIPRLEQSSNHPSLSMHLECRKTCAT